MKSEKNQISTLSEDIQQIIKETQDKQFEMLCLCRDHRNPVLLPDKEPVLHISQDDLVGVFDTKANHFFPDQEQVLRFAVFCKLPVPDTIALMLKAEWEYVLANSIDPDENKSNNLNSVFKNGRLITKVQR